MYEGQETFKCYIDEDTPKGIVRAPPYEATVEIIDDECKWIHSTIYHVM